MQIQIHFHDIERTEAIDSHIEGAMSHLTKFADPDNAHVYLAVVGKKQSFQCKIEFHANRKDYTSTELSDDMYKSIDLAVHKLEMQLRKDHDLRVSQRRHNGSIKSA